MIRACRAQVCLVVVTLAVACTTKTDLGYTCRMTRPKGSRVCGTSADAASTVCPIDPKEVSDVTLNYLSLGAAVCDDLVCLRSANTENPDNTTTEARGYCSRGCVDDSDCSPDVDGKTGTLHCQRLMFSQEYLQQLEKDDPATFQQIFGTVSPGAAPPATSYCVKPAKTP